jgi:arylamine N-acetyltransferase
MDSKLTLAGGLRRAVLNYLEVDRQEPPNLSFLETLITAYTNRVPWESAFRIAKRGKTRVTNDCPRWPDEFWTEAIEKGGGGTCFESNYAFFALLSAIGYRGYLTINDMGDTSGCHAAIVLQMEEGLWLADVGLPIYIPLPMSRSDMTSRSCPIHTYTVTPMTSDRYQVDRDRHSKPNCYTLINRPVAEEEFRRAIINDYGPEGLFLNRVIITKVIGEYVWRFNSEERPFHLERFRNGGMETQELLDDPGEIATVISEVFSIDQETLGTALLQTKTI